MLTRPAVSRRRGRLTAALAALALLATACGGGDGEPSSSTSPTSSAPTGADASDDTGTTPEPEGYLAVPDGVTLTDPGTRLKLKDSAVAAWLPRQDLVGVVDVTVTRIEETTVQASLAGFDLDAEAQRSTPYFVSTKVTNVGETDLGGRQLPIYFLDGRGMLVPPTGVARDFKACPGGLLPAVFAPGDSTTSCLIFLAAEGTSMQSIMFRPPEGVVPVQWKGDAKPLGKSGKAKASTGRERSKGARPS